VPPITNDDDEVFASWLEAQATWLLESGVEDTAMVTP
jgi:hypothetical protein